MKKGPIINCIILILFKPNKKKLPKTNYMTTVDSFKKKKKNYLSPINQFYPKQTTWHFKKSLIK